MSGFIDEFSTTRNPKREEMICPASDGIFPFEEIKIVIKTHIGVEQRKSVKSITTVVLKVFLFFNNFSFT